ncbi:AsmA-like C-terminal region-containing protein [Candidatus Thioglobus sp.]|uniref:YhdP family protein n=1 Tax=Candidatus Thioglobus sp. TaxID=2026721 RepID=UPI002609E454|nr:AsmA-like C-terminal region-containing protein [Candidatus Thioglobus sp.]
MIKKTLSKGIKVLKISTWLSVIFSLLIVLVVGFFVAFPNLIKAPIEAQLSGASGLEVKLSKISFELEADGISLKIHDLKLGSKDQDQPIAQIQGLHWRVNVMNLIDDIYHPSQVFIDVLTLHANSISDAAFSVADAKQLVSLETLEIAHFFESLSIQKTHIMGDDELVISPLDVTRFGSQLLLTVSNQAIGDQNVDIAMTLSSEQLEHDGFLTLPMTFSNDDFSLLSNLKLYHQEDGEYAEFSGYIEQIKAVNLDKYLTASIVGDSTSNWMKRGFKSGFLKNSNIRIVKNLSEESPAEISFNAHLTETELLFNSDWKNLKDLDADISTDGKKIKVLVNNTKLYGFPLANMALEIVDMSKPNLDVHLLGKIDTTSQALMQFLAQAPTGNTVHDVVKQFSLEGQLTGELDLLIPLDDRAVTLDVDLAIDENRLVTLGGAVVIEGYKSTIAFHDNQISTSGTGTIRDIPFEIRVNPKNRGDDKEASFAVELLKIDNDFELYLTRRLDQTWRARIESEVLKTNIEIALTDELPSVRVVGLQVASSDSLKGDWNIQPDDLPSMFLSVHGIFVDEKEIPDFSAKLESANNILKISDLSFEGIGVGDKDLLFNGAWVAGKTGIIAKAKGKELSEFLKKLKVTEKVSGGEFDFDVRLFCNCTPWNMSLSGLSGIAKMNVKEGVFTDKDPNIGRVLSLLNIRAITKRFKLDVADLTDKGFAYDSIDAKITLLNSQARIDNFQLESSSSSINLVGQSNIIDESYDIEAKVTPAIGDAVPAATYLAGGGLVGLGVWLIDEQLFDGKLIDKIVDKVVEFKYKITGSWDEPTIKNISTIL